MVEEMGRQRLGGVGGRNEVRETFIEDKDPLVVHLDPGASRDLAMIRIGQENQEKEEQEENWCLSR